MQDWYLISLCHYWMDTSRFELLQIQADNKRHAEHFGKSLAYDRRSTFNYVSVSVVFVGSKLPDIKTLTEKS